MLPRILEHRIKRPPKLHQLVAERIQEMIASESLPPGAKLPPERVLCDRFDVSRPVIRESMKVLIARGVLKEIPGKGTFVWQNVTEPLRELLNVFAAGHGPNGHRNLFEARSLLEVEIAGLAAERATSEDISALHKLNAKLTRMNTLEGVWSQDKVRDYNELELQFHLGLARCTKNEFFVILLGALAGAFGESWAHIHDRPDTRKQGIELHNKILAAISSGDPRAARRATRDNLKAFLEAAPQQSLTLELSKSRKNRAPDSLVAPPGKSSKGLKTQKK
jgi:GntR family transcriptional regulator, transcriptional repressor for pyruvate dehydrogenase complex